MSKKVIKELKVTITFEPSRVQDAHLAKAYEIAMPLIKRFIENEKIRSKQESKSSQDKVLVS